MLFLLQFDITWVTLLDSAVVRLIFIVNKTNIFFYILKTRDFNACFIAIAEIHEGFSILTILVRGNK